MAGIRVAVAADNAGVALKDELAELMRADDRVVEVSDFGVPDASDDRAYPLLGLAAAQAVADGRADRALLVCGTGIGMAISANKVGGRPRHRRRTTRTRPSARSTSNDCQVLCMGGRVIGAELAKKIVEEWLGHAFDPSSASADKVAHITEFERSHAASARTGG